MLMKHLLKDIKTSWKFRYSIKAFSTAKVPENALSLRFHEMYVKELERIKKNSNDLVEAKYKVSKSTTPTEAYVHPYHSTKFPVYWSTRNYLGFLQEAMGTEPVSPHYESFARSRRYALMMTGAILIYQLAARVNLDSFYGKHASYQVYTLFGLTIGILESRYIVSKVPMPRLTWFYEAYIEHEYSQFWSSWQDSIEEQSRPFLAITKEQLDYYLIHKEFVYIKKRSLSTYLENQKKNLDKHFYDRTVSMLQSIEHMENSNVRHKLRDVIEDALKAVLAKTDTAEGRKLLHNQSFQSALKGLRTGKMVYEGEPLLPILNQEIKSRLEPLKNISSEEESKLFSLTPEQKRAIASSDHRSKIEYLAHPPDVSSASVKNNEAYKHIVSRMKRRIESSFKI